MARANAATRRKQQEAARKRRAEALKITRGVGGGQGNRNRKASTTTTSSKTTTSSRTRTHARGLQTDGSYNPNAKPRKPSVEPGTNRLSRAARAQERAERKAAEERAARRRQQKSSAKPAAKPAAKPSRPNPRMTGEGAPRPNAGDKSSTAKKVSRLAKALSDKKGMKSYMDRLRKKK